MAPSERFHVKLLEDDSYSSEPVVVEVGLDGFNILDANGARAKRKYPLHHISRWSMRGSSLILFTRSPSDVEDRSVTLQGDEVTIRSVLDTLTCSCMQMAEMLQSGQDQERGGQLAANSLNALLKKSKKPALLTADQVEFWHNPEKTGWMHSQGEHIKTWRKRWFVLKQGFLFRFANSEVGPSTKPRGIVDLSTVTDVADGSAATSRPNSIKLTTATGQICYLCESETSQVEWYSAIEGAVARIVKLVAGVDEPDEREGASSSRAKGWAEQLEQTYAAVGSSSSTRGRSSGQASGGGGGRPQMVNIVNYEAPGAGSGVGAGNGSSYVTVDYGSIAGANVVQYDASVPVAGFDGGQARANDGAGGYGNYSNAPTQPAYGYASMPLPQQQPVHAFGGYQQQEAGGGVGGNLMDAVTAPQAPRQAQSSSAWKVHYTAEGRPYFYNSETGTTQWNAPM